MIEDRDIPVEIGITMPVQPRLSHKVWLCLQNYDELGFAVGHFYCECISAIGKGHIHL